MQRMTNDAETLAPRAWQLAKALDGRTLDANDGSHPTLRLRELKPVPMRIGWLRFVLDVEGPAHGQSSTPLMTGFVSGGGRGVTPWVEGRIFPTVEFASSESFDARAAGIEAQLINLLGELIPAGGHLMLEYESPGQRDTHRELLLRVPPAASHLGELMFRAGFRGHFKDWYIAEGGNEGPRKLQGNKSPDDSSERLAIRENAKDLQEFLKRRAPSDRDDAAVIAQAQVRARKLLNFIDKLRSPKRVARKSRGR
jgi:hypothetical protein